MNPHGRFRPTTPVSPRKFDAMRVPSCRTLSVARPGACRLAAALLAVPAVVALFGGAAFAHAVAEGDKGYIQEITGIHLLPFIYLGAKHMVTGYDHILFLFGVIFFLYRLKHIAIYVSLFRASATPPPCCSGVYFNVGINSYIIDAIIGLSRSSTRRSTTWARSNAGSAFSPTPRPRH